MSLSKNQKIYIGCFALIIVFCVGTLSVLSGDHGFGGSDDAGGDTADKYGYQPWTGDILTIITGNPDFELPGETESMLFAVQAAIGAILIGYFMGYTRAASKLKESKSDKE